LGRSQAWAAFNSTTHTRGAFPTTYAWFEASNNTTSGTVAKVSSIARDEHTLSMTEHDMRRALMRVNTRKAADPDGISGRVLNTCANQLAPVFTTIFNLSQPASSGPLLSLCPKPNDYLLLALR